MSLGIHARALPADCSCNRRSTWFTPFTQSERNVTFYFIFLNQINLFPPHTCTKARRKFNFYLAENLILYMEWEGRTPFLSLDSIGNPRAFWNSEMDLWPWHSLLKCSLSKLNSVFHTKLHSKEAHCSLTLQASLCENWAAPPPAESFPWPSSLKFRPFYSLSTLRTLTFLKI